MNSETDDQKLTEKDTAQRENTVILSKKTRRQP